jgi:hypothetical protein
MNKADLIEEVAKVTCSKKEAVVAVDAVQAFGVGQYIHRNDM